MDQDSENISRYDPSRYNVGKIYQDVQLKGDRSPILIGDMSNELIKGCLEDLNCALETDPYGGHPFYVMVHEKKDLQMKNSILRRVIKLPFRPWPEDDTVVFWKDPNTDEVRFCWSLPHWSEMTTILQLAHFHHPDLIEQIRRWKDFDMEFFGFMKIGDCWKANPDHKDRLVV